MRLRDVRIFKHPINSFCYHAVMTTKGLGLGLGLTLELGLMVGLGLMLRIGLGLRLGLGLGLRSAKVEVLLNTINFIYRTPHLESGLIPSPSLLQKHSLTGVTSFEVYVGDITGRRFEKVKNGHIFETGRRCESCIYLPRDSNDMRFNALNKMNQIIGGGLYP